MTYSGGEGSQEPKSMWRALESSMGGTVTAPGLKGQEEEMA